MAKYNALAIPVYDAFRILNHKEKWDVDEASGSHNVVTLRGSLRSAFGKDSLNYINTLIKDINGSENFGRDHSMRSWFKKYKLTKVGNNFRVTALQITSYNRAELILKKKYLFKGRLHPLTMKKGYEDAKKYCKMVQLKDWGMFNMEAGTTTKSIVLNERQTFGDKAIDLAMKGPEMMDKLCVTWLWFACQHEIADTRKDLKVGTVEFKKAVGKRLREVIYGTQVVDSTLTRSHYMRSPDNLDKLNTAFMAEPTLTLNCLEDAFVEYSNVKRAEGKKAAMKKCSGKIFKTLWVYLETASAVALVSTLMGAFRDTDEEDDDEDYKLLKEYFRNLFWELEVFSKMPGLGKTITSAIQGFDSTRADTDLISSTVGTIMDIGDKIFRDKGKGYSLFKNSLKVLDALGYPFYNLYRDAIAGLDKLGIVEEENLKDFIDDFVD
jgi:hypothetical protein